MKELDPTINLGAHLTPNMDVDSLAVQPSADSDPHTAYQQSRERGSVTLRLATFLAGAGTIAAGVLAVAGNISDAADRESFFTPKMEQSLGDEATGTVTYIVKIKDGCYALQEAEVRNVTATANVVQWPLDAEFNTTITLERFNQSICITDATSALTVNHDTDTATYDISSDVLSIKNEVGATGLADYPIARWTEVNPDASLTTKAFIAAYPDGVNEINTWNLNRAEAEAHRIAIEGCGNATWTTAKGIIEEGLKEDFLALIDVLDEGQNGVQKEWDVVVNLPDEPNFTSPYESTVRLPFLNGGESDIDTSEAAPSCSAIKGATVETDAEFELAASGSAK